MEKIKLKHIKSVKAYVEKRLELLEDAKANGVNHQFLEGELHALKGLLEVIA